MALGDNTTVSNVKKATHIMAATANVAAPTLATDGVAMYPSNSQTPQVQGHSFGGRPPLYSTLCIKGRVNAGQVLTGTFTLWGYLAVANAWFEIPVNGGTVVTPVALAETSSDQINYQEQFMNLGHFDRVALELSGIGGTGATFDAWLVTAMLGGQ